MPNQPTIQVVNTQRRSTSNRSADLVAGAAGATPMRTKVIVGVVVVLLILLGGAVIAHVSDSSGGSTSSPAAGRVDPLIRIGPSDAKVVVTVVEDFQCPHCKQFEATAGSTLAELAASGVGVAYQPISILDRASTTQYSTRAAAAAYCVADAAPGKWVTWHNEVFAQQPPEGGAGLSDETLVEIAKKVGVSSTDVEDCITSQRYAGFVTTQTSAALATGLSHTPTVLVNGVEAQATPEAIRAAVKAAA